jgi:hypothetical protein
LWKVVRVHLNAIYGLKHPISQTKISQVPLQSWYKPSARAYHWIMSLIADHNLDKFDLLPEYTLKDIESATLLENLGTETAPV